MGLYAYDGLKSQSDVRLEALVILFAIVSARREQEVVPRLVSF